MRITFDDVAQRFEAVISGQISFEDADQWACSIMQGSDDGTLVFEPQSDRDRIWRGITYLRGVDLQSAPGTYLHTLDDVQEAFALINEQHP